MIRAASNLMSAPQRQFDQLLLAAMDNHGPGKLGAIPYRNSLSRQPLYRYITIGLLKDHRATINAPLDWTVLPLPLYRADLPPPLILVVLLQAFVRHAVEALAAQGRDAVAGAHRVPGRLVEPLLHAWIRLEVPGDKLF